MHYLYFTRPTYALFSKTPKRILISLYFSLSNHMCLAMVNIYVRNVNLIITIATYH